MFSNFFINRNCYIKLINHDSVCELYVLYVKKQDIDF